MYGIREILKFAKSVLCVDTVKLFHRKLGWF